MRSGLSNLQTATTPAFSVSWEHRVLLGSGGQLALLKAAAIARELQSWCQAEGTPAGRGGHEAGHHRYAGRRHHDDWIGAKGAVARSKKRTEK